MESQNLKTDKDFLFSAEIHGSSKSYLSYSKMYVGGVDNGDPTNIDSPGFEVKNQSNCTLALKTF